MEELFAGQAAFLADYKLLAKELPSDERIIEDVLKQLNAQTENAVAQLEYVLPAQQTNTQETAVFPFTRELHSEDLEATISTTYVYQGEPYNRPLDSDDQK